MKWHKQYKRLSGPNGAAGIKGYTGVVRIMKAEAV